MNKLYVVGIGPGSYEEMTIRAMQCLEKSDVIIGYTVYVDLIRSWYEGQNKIEQKRILSTPMKREMERCHMAFQEAEKGNTVSMVCSGDAGVYGMAGPILEIADQYKDVEIEIVPGVTAALSGAAILGAPLTHDFAVISLSDLMTPIEKIWQRIEMASKADLSICIYNPSSKKRADYLRKACELMLQYKSPNTICGIARQIGRDGQETKKLTLEQLKEEEVDMFSTVFIGNSKTKVIGNTIVTPRGYQIV